MRDDAGLLQDILEAIDRIEKYARRGQAAYEADELLQVWAVHHLQIVGEAANKLSPQLRTAHPEIPWSQIIGMRNVLIHDYVDVDLDVVWAAVDRDLPALRARIEAVLQELQRSV